ncbi:MAG TPA: PAS domain S-box protein, partial [Candidatus Wallbacteria bacterium]|nr:PAS domain S-box protein [Candidatus Wallbacteria bacterium]
MFNQDGYSNAQRPEENTQDLYGLIFKHFDDPVFIADGYLKLIETNPAGCGLLGYGPEEIQGMDFMDLIHPQDHFLLEFSNIKEPGGKKSKAYRVRLLKKDGTAVNSKLFFDVYQDDLVTVSCRQFSNINSSDYFNQYANLKDPFRTSIDALPLWISCIDTTGKYFFANRHYSNTFKIPLENIIGHYYKEFFPAGLYEKHKKLAEECMGRGATVTFEDESDFGNGFKPCLYGIYTPLFDEDNAVFGMSVAVFDISERKELELRVKKASADLKESEAKFRALVENSVCGIGISSANKIIYANDTLMKMYGYDDFKEFSSRDLIDYLTPESKNYLKNWRDKKRLGEKVPKEFEVEIIHTDKSVKTLLITVSELKIKNETFYESAFIDITEIKKSEERIKEIAGRYECIVAASGQIAYDYNGITGEIS